MALARLAPAVFPSLRRLAVAGAPAARAWPTPARPGLAWPLVDRGTLSGRLGEASRACLQRRAFAAAAAAPAAEPRLSQAASDALGSIKQTMRKQQVQLTKAQRRNLQGNIRRYKLMGGRDEFHNVDRNRNGRIFEPWHSFEIVISSSKNNCWITVKNKSWRYRCVMASHAGNVGFRKAAKKSEQATQAIALNIARKLKRLGVMCAEVTFRKIMKVETCLQAFQSVGLQITRLTHQPRLPHGDPAKPRKQRRV